MHPYSFGSLGRFRASFTRSPGGWLLVIGAALLLAILLPAGCNDDDPSGPDNGEDGNGEPEIRHPEDFLPLEASGMERDGATQVATDAATLQDIIDGGYQVHTNHGFREMAQQEYTGTVGGAEASIRVRIYDQTTAENAAAVQDELVFETTFEEVNLIGDEDHRNTEFSSYTILFRRNEYLTELVIDNSSQDAKDLLAFFATHIDTEITGS